MSGCNDCPVARSLRDRIEALEERCERAEAAAEENIVSPPFEWSLTPQEGIVASCLARGEVTTDALLAAMEFALPTTDGRSRCHARVVVHKVRTKLEDFGWILCVSDNHSSIYRIHPEQLSAYQDALRGTGSHAYPSMTSKRKGAA